MSLPEHVKGKDCHTLDTSTGKMSGWGREGCTAGAYGNKTRNTDPHVIKDDTLKML